MLWQWEDSIAIYGDASCNAIQPILWGNDKNKYLLQHIRPYNNMFYFTSMGGKIDRSVNSGHAPPVFRMHGQIFHLIGSMLPSDGESPKFAQLYINDTQNEIFQSYRRC